jgi:hypothetical protein
MTVYLLLGVWHYDGYDILGVFSSREAAIMYRDQRMQVIRYDEIKVQEWTVDSVLNELKEEL